MKNTFLHVDIGDEDFDDVLWEAQWQRVRAESEPARSLPTSFHGSQPEDPGEAPPREFAEDFDLDALNKVNLSVCDNRFNSGESANTCSTQLGSSECNGNSSGAEPSEALRGYTTDTSACTADNSNNESSDQDGEFVKRVRGRGPCMEQPSWNESINTVMIRQVPRSYTQWMLMAEVNKRGFENLFDFIYLPFDFRKGVNVGYGFLSFMEPKSAQAFRDTFDGVYLDHVTMHKGKPIRVHPATVQGYEANLRHFMQTKTNQHQDPQISPLFRPRAGVGKRSPPLGASQAAAAGWVTVDGVPVQVESMQSSAERKQAPHPALPMEPGFVHRRFCHACGIPHSVRHNFCANCGARLEHKGVPDE